MNRTNHDESRERRGPDPFLVAEYQRLGGATTNTALSAFLKERESDYAVAVQLCPNGCGGNSAGAVSADRARPAGREPKAGAATVPQQESVESFACNLQRMTVVAG